MKTYKLIYLFALSLFIVGCNDSFMDRFPETSITEPVFFASPQDLETYSNSFYQMIGGSFWDAGTDNVMYIENADIYNIMMGVINEKNAKAWGDYWKDIFKVNFMIARSHQAVGDKTEINHYIGIARFFRAYLYYNLVKRYSDVPWYNRDLKDTDTELLYKKQDPRTLVVDSIMADLKFATEYIKEGTSQTRITKNAALALQSRIALHEGTFRKYHPELGLNDANEYLELAASAAFKVIDKKKFSLPDYIGSFNGDLKGNSDMILYSDYDQALRRNNTHSAFDWTTGLSRDLMEDYLAIVGGKAVPFQQLPGYNTKTLVEIFQDARDPRMAQTIMEPGYIDPGKSAVYRLEITRGGYPQIKFRATTADQLAWDKSYNDIPIFRYAEVLLNYAEARAELGKLTDEDMELTIKEIRERAGLPFTSLSDWLANIDPVQANRYSNVSSTQKGAVYEVRRERRIELACEGFRYDDLMRWGLGKLLEKAPEGSYIKQLGYQDITGDGQPDIAIVKTQADADAIPQADKDNYKLNVFILENVTFELTEGDKGYIVQKTQVGKFTFIEPKYYYYPISQNDMTVNKNLEQNKYWK